MVYDINSDELNNAEKYPNYSPAVRRFEVIQNSGEVLFVPSGWYHQVHNLVRVPLCAGSISQFGIVIGADYLVKMQR